MGFFSNILYNISLNSQRKAINKSIQLLKGMDDVELLYLYKIVMFTKDKLYDLYHINLDDPFLAVQENNNIAIILSRDIYDIQKIEGSIAVSGMTIWLHTVRAALAPEIRYLGSGLVIFKGTKTGYAEGMEVSHAYPVLSFRKPVGAYQTVLSPFSRCSACR